MPNRVAKIWAWLRCGSALPFDSAAHNIVPRLRNLVPKGHTWLRKVRDVIRMVQEDGWVLVRTRGSHHHFRHPGKPGTVTVPGNPNFELHPKTLASILKQAGLRKEGNA